MKRVFILFSLSALILFVGGCDKESIDAKSTEQLHRENGVPVKLMVVESKPLEIGISYNSVLTGWKESVASAMVTDRVSEIRYKVGDYVNKDDVVISFPIDNPSAQYNQSKAAFENAQTTLNRMKSLYEAGGISLQDLDNIQTQYNVSKANYDAVKQTLKVKAPISGVISQISVQETDNVSSGDKLFTVSNFDKLKTQVWVSTENIAFIKVGSPATATWKNHVLNGKITQVDLAFNRDHQAFGVIAEFDNSDSVPSGVSAEIELAYFEKTNSIFVDRKNMVKEEDKHFVYLANSNHAKKREVKLGRSLDTMVEVLEGVKNGDKLITEGLQLLDDETLIMVLDQ